LRVEYEIAIGSRRGKRNGAPPIRLFVSKKSYNFRKLMIGIE